MTLEKAEKFLEQTLTKKLDAESARSYAKVVVENLEETNVSDVDRRWLKWRYKTILDMEKLRKN